MTLLSQLRGDSKTICGLRPYHAGAGRMEWDVLVTCMRCHAVLEKEK